MMPLSCTLSACLLVKETKILYMMFARKQLIQQGDEQPFTGRLPEDDLKPQVGKGIDES